VVKLPQPIQRQQEEQQETPEIQAQLAADSAQKSSSGIKQFNDIDRRSQHKSQKSPVLRLMGEIFL
jgi:hypothetical protein